MTALLPVRRLWSVACVLLAVAAGCAREEGVGTELPNAATAAAEYGEGVEAELRGNLLEVRVELPDELRRGGRIWAQGSPYFYLLSGSTRDLFVENPDLAAVRVITENAAGEEVARATLLSDELSEFQWRDAIAIAALAQTEGTERPGRIQDLILFGEEHTEFEYTADDAGR